MGEAKHAATRGVARGQVGNDARTVSAGWARVARVLAEHVEHVAEVEPHGAHAEHNLCPALRLEGGLRLEEEVAQRAARVKAEPDSTGEGGRCSL